MVHVSLVKKIGTSSQHRPIPVLIFWGIIPCVYFVCTEKNWLDLVCGVFYAGFFGIFVFNFAKPISLPDS